MLQVNISFQTIFTPQLTPGLSKPSLYEKEYFGRISEKRMNLSEKVQICRLKVESHTGKLVLAGVGGDEEKHFFAYN